MIEEDGKVEEGGVAVAGADQTAGRRAGEGNWFFLRQTEYIVAYFCSLLTVSSFDVILHEKRRFVKRENRSSGTVIFCRVMQIYRTRVVRQDATRYPLGVNMFDAVSRQSRNIPSEIVPIMAKCPKARDFSARHDKNLGRIENNARLQIR